MANVTAETFVVLQPFTQEKSIIIGRNTFLGVCQEIHYYPAASEAGSKKLTHIEIDDAPSFSVILNKPATVWGAESGANDQKVVIALTYSANETNNNILAVDLVRLALERGSNAETAISKIVELIENYGSNIEGKEAPTLCFLICDPENVFILNIVGKLWATEKVENNFRGFGAGLTVGSNISKASDGLQDKCKALGLWDGNGDFSFSQSFESETSTGDWSGSEPTSEETFSLTCMFDVLRSTNESKSPGPSHVSVLSPTGICSHWFTATPNPKESVYKPFLFTFNTRISNLTKIPDGEELTILHKLHSQRKWENVGSLLKSLESTCVEEVNKYLNEHPGTPNQELDDLMKDCVEAEVKFYR